MKARIKDTDEVVDVKYDYMDEAWINRTGNNTFRRYHERELEFLEEKDIDWEERRYEIARQIMDSQLSCCGYERSMIEQSAKFSVECADALIAELKKGGER